MKKIFTKSVFEWNDEAQKYELNHADSESYLYDGALALCGGGLSGGGGGGGSGNTTTVQKSDPWPQQQPFLVTGFNKAQDYLNGNQPQYFPGNTVVPFSNETNQALNMQENRATNGSPLSSSAQGQLTNTMNGGYLNSMPGFYNSMQGNVNNAINPIMSGSHMYGGDGFNAALQAATNKILPQVSSSFEGSGRLNSGLADVAKSQAIGDSFASLYGQNQQNQLAAAGLGSQSNQALMSSIGAERENQLRGTMFAPQMANQDYTDISKLAEVGAQKESLQQQQLQSNIDRYNFGQNTDLNKLQNYMGLIQGNYGGTSSTTSPYFQNRTAGFLGGGIGGASLGASMFPAAASATPWGAIGGGALGLLSGFL